MSTYENLRLYRKTTFVPVQALISYIMSPTKWDYWSCICLQKTLCNFYFSVALKEDPDKDNFRKKEIALAYCLRGILCIMMGKVWQQECSMHHDGEDIVAGEYHCDGEDMAAGLIPGIMKGRQGSKNGRPALQWEYREITFPLPLGNKTGIKTRFYFSSNLQLLKGPQLLQTMSPAEDQV